MQRYTDAHSPGGVNITPHGNLQDLKKSTRRGQSSERGTDLARSS